MAQVTQRLRRHFPQTPPGEIDRLLTDIHRSYDGRPIRHFVPVLVERGVSEVLRTATVKRRHAPATELEPATPAGQLTPG